MRNIYRECLPFDSIIIIPANFNNLVHGIQRIILHYAYVYIDQNGIYTPSIVTLLG